MADENPSPGSTSSGDKAAGSPNSSPAAETGNNHGAAPAPYAAKPLPTQIILNPSSRPQTQTPPAPAKAPEEPKDNFREVVETIVFVVVLVLLLKTFLAEAFVIPTGSMATTLLGYHYQITCEQCNYTFPVNASNEADPQDGPAQPVSSCTCPNCGAENRRLGGRGQ